MALDADSKIFVVYMTIRKQEKMPLHSKIQAKIEAEAKIEITAHSRAQIRALLFDEAFTAIPVEYFNYGNVFSVEKMAEFLEYIRMNEHAIKLEESKQSLFGSIYSLGLVELEMLKTYIKINLANSFIWLSKSPAGTLILFD